MSVYKRISILFILTVLVCAPVSAQAASPVVESTNTSSTASGTSHAVSLCTVVSGQLGIVIFAAGTVSTITWPGGWTQFFVDPNPASSPDVAAAYRQLDGGEGASITVTTNASEATAHNVYCISGAEDPATQAPEASTGARSFSSAANPDGLTPTGGSKDYLWIAVADAQDDVTGNPTNYTTELDVVNGFANLRSARRALTASTEDPGTMSLIATANWEAFTFAIHPAAAAASSPPTHSLLGVGK